MKIKFTLLLSLFVFAISLNAQNISKSTNSISLVSTNDTETILDVSINNYSFIDVQTPHGKESILIADDATTLQIESAPDIPKFSEALVIPNDKKMQIEVFDLSYTEIQNVKIAPSKGVITRNIDPSTISYSYGQVYNENQFFPNTQAYLETPFIQRDIRGISVKITPFNYNPVTKTLRIYTHYKIRVYTNGENDNINVLTKKSSKNKIQSDFEAIYRRSYINYTTNNSEKYTPIEEGTPGKMLIISDAGFLTTMQPFVDWKNQKGISTEIVDVATIGNTASAIKTYVEDYYAANPEFCYLLLVGDAPQVTSHYSTNASGDSDNMYGYLAGNDHRIDIFVGRFSGTTTDEIATQVERTIHYEKDITAAESWMQYALCVASDEGAGGGHYGESDIEHEDNIKADYTAYGYTSVATCYQSTGQTTDDISTAINDHCGIITYTGHGDTQMWYSVDYGGYTNSHVNALTNDNHLPFIFSVACVAGDFVTNTCFGEAWQRATNGGNPSGAIANIASTINQSWQSPMEAQDEFIDILTESYSNNIKRTFGGIVANGWGLMIDAYGSDGENMADTWTCFGDPAVMVRTKQPQEMTITHASTATAGATSFLVNCDEEGALVSITINNVIYGTEYASGGSANVSLSPALPSSGSFLVTVTAYNRVTYQAEVTIGSPMPPVCDFQGVPTTVYVGNSVAFTDLSTNGPTSWDWSFPGADVTSSTDQNPSIVYSTVGTYDVSLTVTNTEGSDDLTKNSYITVIDTSALTANFVANNTTVTTGQAVDFTDMSTTPNGTITSWDWTFNSADVTSSTDQNPIGITWSTVGDYTVELTVNNDNGETDTETKIEYIHVIDPNDTPQADFQASQTTLVPGTIIDYTNLSTLPSMIDSSKWILESAEAPNDNITVSLANNLTGVVYNAAPGYYDATLIIYSSFGTDTMYKDDYIYIIDPNDLDTVYANFTATTPRLIQQGWTVEFTDLSVGPVTNWHWEFEGGTPSSYDGQYPPAITYNSTDGPFDVTLEVSNADFEDTEYKPEYIVVITQWPWPDEDGFCEGNLTNIPEGDPIPPARHLISNPGEWGYFPGHNYLKIKYYAEKFTNYTFDKIREVHVAPSRIQNNSQNYNKVKYYVWDVDSLTGMPGDILGSKTTYISDYTQDQYNNIVFDTPVEVSEEFYVGFYIYYPSTSSGEPQDTFATYFSGNRPNGPNTTVVSKTSTGWMTPTEMLGDTLNMSLDLRLKACIIKVEDIDYSEEVKLYPNPTTGKVTIELGDIPIINPTVEVYDITGRKIYTNCIHLYENTYELDLKGNQTGFYIINMDFGDARVTKKVTLIN